MRKIVGLLCCLALTAAAGMAERGAPVDLAAILGTSNPAPAASRVGLEKATCIANCSPGPYVSCSTANPYSSCTAVDRNCAAGQRGYVTCDGVTQYCASTCPTTCTPGAFRYLWTGYCCFEGGKEKEQQQCIGGTYWEYTGVVICGGPCGPLLP